jgi:hypothetical protein
MNGSQGQLRLLVFKIQMARGLFVIIDGIRSLGNQDFAKIDLDSFVGRWGCRNIIWFRYFFHI